MKFLKRVGLGILALIVMFILARIWHQMNPFKDAPRIREGPGGIRIELPDKEDDN